MKQDIPILKVENIAVAVVKELNEEKTVEVYNVYLLNLKKSMIKNVMVSSKGYGQNATTGESVKTSTLRHFIGDVDEQSFVKIEPIIEEVFALSNEYWVSFYENNQILDKKFIFLAESITDENMINVPLINKKGVMI
jgi:DNA-binding protein Fis